ncbi:unnamed protein product [Ixodes pacificus]
MSTRDAAARGARIGTELDLQGAHTWLHLTFQTQLTLFLMRSNRQRLSKTPHHGVLHVPVSSLSQSNRKGPVTCTFDVA